MTFEEKFNESIRKCMNAYNKAEQSLSKLTLLIQKKYPSLEATMSGGEIFFMDMDSPHRDEYYSLEDIEERYMR